MAFQMGVDTLSGFKVIPTGLYSVRLKGFKPRLSKNKDSVNFNAQMEVINNPEHDGAKLFEGLNSKAGFMQAEFTHAFGLALEDNGNGQYVMPGVWDGDPGKFKESDPSTWVYDGPLLGREAQVEVAIDTYDGKENNKVRRYFCALPNCAEVNEGFKHSEDLLKKK